MSPHALERPLSPSFLAILFAALALTGLGAQARTEEYRVSALSGPPEAPRAALEGSLILVESFDRQGRLVSVGRGPRPQPGGSGTGAGTVTGAGGPGAVSASPGKAPELHWLDIAYEAGGRVSSLTERKAKGEAASQTRRLRDGSGRLVRVERLEKGEVVEILSILYEGSGRRATLALREAGGALLSTALLDLGQGGVEGRSLDLSILDATGAEAGGLALALDGAGRLVRWEALVPPSAAAGKEGRKAQRPVAAGPVQGGGPALPGIAELLFPLFPSDPAGFELFARLETGSVNFSALRASGLGDLGLERPSEGRVELLWDGAGRLLEARSLDSAGAPTGWAGFRYDGAGRLVESELSGRFVAPAGGGAPKPGAGPPAVAAPAAPASEVPAAEVTVERQVLLFTYFAGADPGTAWRARSTFLRSEPPAPPSLSALEYLERLIRP